MLQEQFKHYVDNQQHFVSRYNNKFIVLKDLQVVGAFDAMDEAYDYAVKRYEPGTFIIQKCTEGDKDYTQTFHSRAIFA
ncbi:MAG: hypothetical protein LBL94_12150 [Prevotellaceae bacterium]|jgi:hypothetical protein|nr:hypothetical protein [Prevotellaceae bacterium]